jgi:hypothetical protein
MDKLKLLATQEDIHNFNELLVNNLRETESEDLIHDYNLTPDDDNKPYDHITDKYQPFEPESMMAMVVLLGELLRIQPLI